MGFVHKSIRQFHQRVNNKFVRFLMVGSLNTAFGLGVYCTAIFLAAPYFIATLASNVLGVLFNFVTTGNLVFENGDRRLIFRFVACYAAVYLINTATVKLLLLTGLNSYWAGTLATPPVAVCSFFLLKYFVYSKPR